MECSKFSDCPVCGGRFAPEDMEVDCPSCHSLGGLLIARRKEAGHTQDLPIPLAANQPHAQERAGLFQTTNWSVFRLALETDSKMARAALEELCQTYWYPVYILMRCHGNSPDRSKDLTQDFFCHFLNKCTFGVADPERGRFRTFLRVCVRNFLNQSWQRQNAIKRGGGQSFVPFDEELAESRYAAERSGSMAPDEMFERRWALTLLDQAMECLKAEFVETGRADQFEALQVFLSGAKEAGCSYAKIGKKLGMTDCAVRQAARRMRCRFGEILRMKVAQTVASSAEVEEEMRHLCAVLSR